MTGVIGAGETSGDEAAGEVAWGGDEVELSGRHGEGVVGGDGGAVVDVAVDAYDGDGCGCGNADGDLAGGWGVDLPGVAVGEVVGG